MQADITAAVLELHAKCDPQTIGAAECPALARFAKWAETQPEFLAVPID